MIAVKTYMDKTQTRQHRRPFDKPGFTTVCKFEALNSIEENTYSCSDTFYILTKQHSLGCPSKLLHSIRQVHFCYSDGVNTYKYKKCLTDKGAAHGQVAKCINLFIFFLER